MQTKITQAPSRIPQQPQVAMQHLQVPQVGQASTKILRPQFTSNIPQTAINRPQTPLRIPRIPTKLPQMSSNQPQIPTGIQQTFVKQPEHLHQSIAHQTQIHSVQQPSQLPKTIRDPISQAPMEMSASEIPKTTTQLRTDIQHFKNKLGIESNIRQLGNLQDLRQSEAVSNQPRSIPQKVIQDKYKQVAANLKISDSIGNIRKVRARPVNEATCKFKIYLCNWFLFRLNLYKSENQ